MNWFTLLKQPELRTGSKVTTNLGIGSKEEEDDCERKIMQYVSKLKSERSDYINQTTSADLVSKKSLFGRELTEEMYCNILKVLSQLKYREDIYDGRFYEEFKNKNGSKYHISGYYSRYISGKKDAIGLGIQLRFSDWKIALVLNKTVFIRDKNKLQQYIKEVDWR
jgi:hypothetical protein